MGNEPPILWIAGVGWDDMMGTDRRMVTAIAAHRGVLWVDSPHRRQWRGWIGGASPAVDVVADSVVRLRVPAPPGFSRRPIRPLTDALQHITERRITGRRFSGPVIVASPVATFPHLPSARRILYLTDDWIGGSGLLGLEQTWVRETVYANAAQSDAVVAISPPLLDGLRANGVLPPVTAIIPNGAPSVAVGAGRRDRVAGVVGQLNERLDLGLLEAVVHRGVPLRLVGPRTDSDPQFSRRLTELMDRPDVEWTGAVAPERLPVELSRLGVGLTPYAPSDFNRSSFPLKTLEYLAAGVPVVSSELAASRWLATDHVSIASDGEEFARLVVKALDRLGPGRNEAERRGFAQQHSWERRAQEFLALLDESSQIWG